MSGPVDTDELRRHADFVGAYCSSSRSCPLIRAAADELDSLRVALARAERLAGELEGKLLAAMERGDLLAARVAMLEQRDGCGPDSGSME